MNLSMAIHPHNNKLKVIKKMKMKRLIKMNYNYNHLIIINLKSSHDET